MARQNLDEYMATLEQELAARKQHANTGNTVTSCPDAKGGNNSIDAIAVANGRWHPRCLRAMGCLGGASRACQAGACQAFHGRISLNALGGKYIWKIHLENTSDVLTRDFSFQREYNSSPKRSSLEIEVVRVCFVRGFDVQGVLQE